MPAAALLQAFHRAHTARSLPGLEALFAADGEIVLDGEALPRELLLQRLPEPLVLGPPLQQDAESVSCIYGPDAERVAGEVRLQPRGERIVRLEIRSLPGAPVRPRQRVSIRAVVLAPGPQILLCECQEPGKPGRWWITPGGGREPDEDDLRALRRELLEETGIPVQSLGPCVWQRTHTYLWRAQAVCQHERYYVVPVAQALEPRPSAEDDGALGWRWWPLQELARTEVLFAPRRLPQLLEALLRDGAPASPLDAGL